MTDLISIFAGKKCLPEKMCVRCLRTIEPWSVGPWGGLGPDAAVESSDVDQSFAIEITKD